jgi:hypothetical protein
MISSIFLAPGEAALKTEAGYRKIWSEWLDTTARRIGIDPAVGKPEEVQLKLLTDQMFLAPVMKINGSIEICLTMRIARVEEGGAKVSLGTGPIGVSGLYSRQTAEESVMSVRACFTLTNNEVDLTKLLEKNGIKMTDPEDVTKAVNLLKS